MGVFVALALMSGCKKTTGTSDASPQASDGSATSSARGPAAKTNAGDAAAELESPSDLANAHREDMVKAAAAGRYADVCAGAPTFPSSLCTWVSARAQSNGGSFDRGAFNAFIGREHIKKVSGRIIGDGASKGEYEAAVYGYRRHCVVSTSTTNFKTTGAFSLWVQEQPETRDVAVNSGGDQQWVVLEESDLASDLYDLAHASGIEAQGMAKDLMDEIARFVPYSELKGEYPDASAPASAEAGTAPPPATTGVATVDPEAKAKARAACMQACVAGCKDDSGCEMTCATKKCPK